MPEPLLPSRVLVVLDSLDELEHVTERALRLAAANQGDVTILLVVEGPRTHFLTRQATERQVRIHAQIVRALEHQLEERVAPLRSRTIPITTRLLSGRLFEETVRTVLRDGHDLVLHPAASTEMPGSELDSEALHLLRKCPSPVWIDRHAGAPVTRLLVAIDLEPEEEAVPRLSTKLMRLALGVAALDGATVSVVHTWTLYREETLLRLAGDAVSWLETEAAARHAERLHSFLAHFDPDRRRFDVHLEKGRPEDVVPRLITREGIDLLVFGSATRAGIPGLLIGSTAERLVHRSRCSLLAAKPDGFRSAVAP